MIWVNVKNYRLLEWQDPHYCYQYLESFSQLLPLAISLNVAATFCYLPSHTQIVAFMLCFCYWNSKSGYRKHTQNRILHSHNLWACRFQCSNEKSWKLYSTLFKFVFMHANFFFVKSLCSFVEWLFCSLQLFVKLHIFTFFRKISFGKCIQKRFIRMISNKTRQHVVFKYA